MDTSSIPFISFIPGWWKWMLFTIIPLMITIFKNRGGPLMGIKEKLDTTLETVGNMAKTVRDLAAKVDKIALELNEKFPEGTRGNNAIQVVGGVAGGAIQFADMLENALEQVRDNERKIIKASQNTQPLVTESPTSILLFETQSSDEIKEGLKFIEPTFTEGVLDIEEEIEKQGAQEWEEKLVGFFMDGNLPYSLVQAAIKEKWKLIGYVSIDFDGNLYYFKFSDPQDRSDVLEEGSFYIARKLFVIRAWSNEIEEKKSAIRELSIWVKFLHVPKQLMNVKGLSKLASSIGTPLFVDKVTETRKLLNVARVCINIKADKELPNAIKAKVGGKVTIIPLEYSWKPLVCTKCDVFGHSTATCVGA